MAELEPQNPEQTPLITIKEIKPTPEEFEQTVDEMFELHQKAYGEHSLTTREQMRERLTERPADTLNIGVYIRNKLVGDIGITTGTKDWLGSWYLFGLATDPSQQGKGMGDILLKEVLRRAEKYQTCVATARPNNYGSIALFVNNNNFRVTQFLPNHFGPGQHRVLMEISPQIRNMQFDLDLIRISSNDIDALNEKLNNGYVGVGVERSQKVTGDSTKEETFLLLRKLRRVER